MSQKQCSNNKNLFMNNFLKIIVICIYLKRNFRISRLFKIITKRAQLDLLMRIIIFNKKIKGNLSQNYYSKNI